MATAIKELTNLTLRNDVRQETYSTRKGNKLNC